MCVSGNRLCLCVCVCLCVCWGRGGAPDAQTPQATRHTQLRVRLLHVLTVSCPSEVSIKSKNAKSQCNSLWLTLTALIFATTSESFSELSAFRPLTKELTRTDLSSLCLLHTHTPSSPHTDTHNTHTHTHQHTHRIHNTLVSAHLCPLPHPYLHPPARSQPALSTYLGTPSPRPPNDGASEDVVATLDNAADMSVSCFTSKQLTKLRSASTLLKQTIAPS